MSDIHLTLGHKKRKSFVFCNKINNLTLRAAMHKDFFSPYLHIPGHKYITSIPAYRKLNWKKQNTPKI